MEPDPMDDLMATLREFVLLANRRGGSGLTPAEHARWAALEKVIPGTGRAPDRSDEDREGDGMPALVARAGGFEPARLLAVSRDGMRLAVRQSLPGGTCTVVQVAPAGKDLEYTFPCKVAWSDEDKMGLAFDGDPACGRADPAAIDRQRALDLQRAINVQTGWGARRGPGKA
jgi:hypothetical protein